jgi:ubiquinol-cytochrome c reductase cytochrome b subunit
LVLPFSGQSLIRRNKFYTFNRRLFWIFVVVFILLTWAGAQPVEIPIILTAQCLAVIYFLYFLVDPFVIIMWDYI